MALKTGKRLGPYENLKPIAAGGMGEVYKAKDLKLGRDGAIKVLPGEMASDSDRVRRFEQEARATSALNHPNIITIEEPEHAWPQLISALASAHRGEEPRISDSARDVACNPLTVTGRRWTSRRASRVRDSTASGRGLAPR